MEIGLVSEWEDDVGTVDVKDLIDLMMIYKKDLRRMRLAPHGLGREAWSGVRLNHDKYIGARGPQGVFADCFW